MSGLSSSSPHPPLGEEGPGQLLERWILHFLESGERLSPERLCADCPEHTEALRALLEEYQRVVATLERPASVGVGLGAGTGSPPPEELPRFEGFRTVEIIGRGGGGAVYRLIDTELGRTVAGKVIVAGSSLGATLESFLDEARALALFDDPRIVRLLEFRGESDPPLLLMEHVDGFRLDEVAPSLDHRRRAEIAADLAEALAHAHSRGVLHNDLKPANILLDKRLRPKILDFGLSALAGDDDRGGGTLPYMAPERLEGGDGSDPRSDVYALGVVLYELLCGERPFEGKDDATLIAAIGEGLPKLPIEVDANVPEPLQAIALKAMERDAEERYASAREMANDLRRYLEGRPVVARPSLYRSVLGHQLRGHLEDIREWLDQRLIYRHEADRLRVAYDRLETRDEDWIVASRVLTPSRIALYLGAFVVTIGAVLFALIRTNAGGEGLSQPLLVLGLPWALLSLLAWHQLRRELPRVAIASLMASLGLLPVLLLIFFQEIGLWPPQEDDPELLLPALEVSNRQLQIAGLLSATWGAWLALRTRTIGLATIAVVTALGVYLASLGDLGLRVWVEEGEYDVLAAWLLPWGVLAWASGWLLEWRQRPWFGRPFYYSAAAAVVLALELLTLDGELLRRLGLSMAAFQPAEVSAPLLLDTITGMVGVGIAIYLLASLVERFGTRAMRGVAALLFVITPFAVLKPLLYLTTTGEYSVRYDWLLLLAGVAVAFFSRVRQRKSFYYAGLFNVGAALWQITAHNEWWERPLWGGLVVVAGVATLLLGVALDWGDFNRRADAPSHRQAS